ncbi:hypothetical protein [Larkinella punicea]|nr:hypothetical protein [Larkinella punicea]
MNDWTFPFAVRGTGILPVPVGDSSPQAEGGLLANGGLATHATTERK